MKVGTASKPEIIWENGILGWHCDKLSIRPTSEYSFKRLPLYSILLYYSLVLQSKREDNT
jgi:hypothetical protein